MSYFKIAIKDKSKYDIKIINSDVKSRIYLLNAVSVAAQKMKNEE
jgi:hypothetical protein